MGGSASRGNVNHAAEFNIWADPEAAAIVFRAGWTVRMIGLDVTLLARATAAVQERMRSLGSARLAAAAPGARAVPGLGRHDGRAAGARRVRDRVASPTPRCSRYTPALVQVETHGTLTSGMTVTDFSQSASHEHAGRHRDRRRPLLDDGARRLRDAPGRAGLASGTGRLKAPVLVASTSGKESAVATIISCAWTACSPTSTRSQ